MFRFSVAFFCDPFAICLRVNARAAGEQNSRTSKALEESARAVQINMTIKIDIATARARAMNHGIEIFRLGANAMF